MTLPKAILLDLDDTILDDSSTIDLCWQRACSSYSHALGDVNVVDVLNTIKTVSQWYWGDAERHRLGRLELRGARREVVQLAVQRLGITDEALAHNIADAYGDHREAGIEPLPDAIDTVRWLRHSGCALALLTNGAGAAQRKKIVRFGLTTLFNEILVEGEVGFGKPDPRIYELALSRLHVGARDVWMAGDNLEWDVAAPQALGVAGIWIDRLSRGLPPHSTVKPHRIIRALSDLRVPGVF